jgi:hypothetical protein
MSASGSVPAPLTWLFIPVLLVALRRHDLCLTFASAITAGTVPTDVVRAVAAVQQHCDRERVTFQAVRSRIAEAVQQIFQQLPVEDRSYGLQLADDACKRRVAVVDNSASAARLQPVRLRVHSVSTIMQPKMSNGQHQQCCLVQHNGPSSTRLTCWASAHPVCRSCPFRQSTCRQSTCRMHSLHLPHRLPCIHFCFCFHCRACHDRCICICHTTCFMPDAGNACTCASCCEMHVR